MWKFLNKNGCRHMHFFIFFQILVAQFIRIIGSNDEAYGAYFILRGHIFGKGLIQFFSGLWSKRYLATNSIGSSGFSLASWANASKRSGMSCWSKYALIGSCLISTCTRIIRNVFENLPRWLVALGQFSLQVIGNITAKVILTRHV